MNKHYLQSKVKSTGVSYIFLWFFGAHYAYLGHWGLQILFWCTFGGCGVWWFIDLFCLPGKVGRYNAVLFQQIEDIEKKEKAQNQADNIAMITAIKEK